jgi:lipoprotein-anchoring transpeptidase ErfK/SrfK
MSKPITGSIASSAGRLFGCSAVALLMTTFAPPSVRAETLILAMTSLESAAPSARQTMREQDAAVTPDAAAEVPSALHRQVVSYSTTEAAGTIVIDTPNTYLYYVLGGGRAIRYGIGVGRDGFTWSGIKRIERKTEWPDWLPPSDMLKRQPYLPRFMAGGPGNPLGARAMYLSGSVYRIHGTNNPSSIGKHVSSGCIRMLNADVIDLYERARIGTKVVVLPALERASAFQESMR